MNISYAASELTPGVYVGTITNSAELAAQSPGLVSVTLTVDLNGDPSPGNGVVLTSRTPQFTWSPIPGAEWYYVWVERKRHDVHNPVAESVGLNVDPPV